MDVQNATISEKENTQCILPFLAYWNEPLTLNKTLSYTKVNGTMHARNIQKVLQKVRRDQIKNLGKSRHSQNQIFHLNKKSIQQKNNFGLQSKPRMNAEEKYQNKKCCLSFSDIFHYEEQKLTFILKTSHVKPHIITKDEVVADYYITS